jgi:AcrR family transcriptional regulator
MIFTMEPPKVKPVAGVRRQRRKLRTPNPEVRGRLLQAAGELILERGFPSLRIDEIAERAGLSVGTFYLYFEGKDELFTSLVVEQTRLLRERLNRAMEGAASRAERGARRLDAYLDFVEETEPGFKHYLRAGSMETTVGDLSTWAFTEHAQDVLPIVEEIVGDKLDPAELELLVQANLAVTQHLAGYWLEHKDRFSRARIQKFIQDVTAAVLVGLRSR